MQTNVVLPEEGNGKKVELKQNPIQNSTDTEMGKTVETEVEFDFTEKKTTPPRTRAAKETPVKKLETVPHIANPFFKRAATIDRRVKLFLWGDSGAGKTTLALQFPSPVVIDFEGGTALYGNSFGFDVLQSNSPDEVMSAIDWLLKNKHNYKTLVVDPITILWDALQKKWSDIFLTRNKVSKGYKHEFYDMQPKDWQTVKSEFKDILRKLIALDMNVIVTAREKIKYKEGSMMIAMGETFDGEKSLPYMFDTIVRLYLDKNGRHIGTCLKDRSNRLPKQDFEVSYSFFEQIFGKDNLTRAAQSVSLITEEQKERLGELLRQFKVTEEQLHSRLSAYDAESIDDLTTQNAEVIIHKLEDALKNKER
ncbi:MAG: ATP-binding protein [Magnetococcales bacterium]|nr:ATP-binding protein [Nitrospirota bacterium]